MNSASTSPSGREHTQGAVSGVGQGAGCVGDPLEHAWQIEIGAEVDHRVQQRPQSVLTGEHIADPAVEFLQQRVEADPGQRREPERLVQLVPFRRAVLCHATIVSRRLPDVRPDLRLAAARSETDLVGRATPRETSPRATSTGSA